MASGHRGLGGDRVLNRATWVLGKEVVHVETQLLHLVVAFAWGRIAFQRSATTCLPAVVLRQKIPQHLKPNH